MRPKLRLLLVEEHLVVRAGLASILGAQPDMIVASEVQNAEDAIVQLRVQSHDLILMDAQTSGKDNLRLIPDLLRVAPGVKVLIFSDRHGDGDILRALDAGAAGYMLKRSTREQIVSTVRRVSARDRYLSADVAQRITLYLGKQVLTGRELEVLALVREGWRNRQIAERLDVAETTVNFHVRNALCKLAANDRTHAVTIAIRRGLLPILDQGTAEGKFLRQAAES